MNNPISIITFHHVHPNQDRLTVPPALFETALEEVSKRYTIISYDRFKNILFGNTKITARRQVLVTFDDGYLNNYLYAYPVIKKLQIPIVIFLVTGLIATADRMRSTMESIEHKILWRNPDPQYFLNTAEIQNMLRSGLVSFASHSHSHLSCKNQVAEVLSKEFMESSRFLQHMGFDAPPYGFCWPRGEYDHNALRIIGDSPFTFAFSTIDGGWQRGDEVYTIRRIDCSSFSGDVADYLSRLKRKLLIYSTPIFGRWYSLFKYRRTLLDKSFAKKMCEKQGIRHVRDSPRDHEIQK
jgi:peptidoglycan/xylan/chitin deacetylase (PgdA/CDA1 family)